MTHGVPASRAGASPSRAGRAHLPDGPGEPSGPLPRTAPWSAPPDRAEGGAEAPPSSPRGVRTPGGALGDRPRRGPRRAALVAAALVLAGFHLLDRMVVPRLDEPLGLRWCRTAAAHPGRTALALGLVLGALGALGPRGPGGGRGRRGPSTAASESNGHQIAGIQPSKEDPIEEGLPS